MERSITVYFHNRLPEKTIDLIIRKYNLKIVDQHPGNPWIFIVEFPEEMSGQVASCIFSNHPDCYLIE